jgi:TfoX/Sxy family transcriptional regulator of competence genes
MPFDEKLAGNVRACLADQKKVEEKKMMGGLTFMVNNKMCVGVLDQDLMARIDPELYEQALEKPGCREMNFTGRPMKGFVFVGPEGTRKKSDLQYWMDLALEFNKRARPSKKRKTGSKKA